MTSMLTDNGIDALNEIADLITRRPDEVIDCGLVLIKQKGTDRFLGVTRKHDHNDVGLPGGKLDGGESFKDCAIREVLEETGYTIKLSTGSYFVDTYKGLYCRTYLAEITDAPKIKTAPEETGIVGFFDKQEFLDGSFGEYNAKMFKYFNQ